MRLQLQATSGLKRPCHEEMCNISITMSWGIFALILLTMTNHLKSVIYSGFGTE